MSKSLTYYKNLFSLGIVKRLLQSNPEFYIAIQKFRYRGKRYRRKIVSRKTNIVIEGYPRSANSFSVKAFMFSNGDEYNIATHQHAYPQVIVGVKMKIPTMVLIRNPFDAVLSFAALRAQSFGLEEFNRRYNVLWLLKDYVVFYKNLLPYKDEFVVAPFTEVLENYGGIISKINEKYNTDFIPFEHSEENLNKVFSISKEHLSPSKKRDEIKEHFIKEMNIIQTTKLFGEAERLYSIFTKN